MRRLLAALLVPLLALAYLSAEPRAQTTAVPAAAASAKTWDGRNVELENYIRDADIVRFEEVALGVTHPRRAYLKPGGPVTSIAWKVLPPGRQSGYWESYKSEIAAYEMDKLLGLGMVPVAVEKSWKGETAAAILWIAPVHPWKEMQPKPKPAKWVRQVVDMKMFDNLICNKDRNMGNLLVDDEWNLFLIDHSRAFIDSKDLAVPMEHIDRELWGRMAALDEPALSAAIGRWVDGRNLRAMLARRDKMRAAIDKLVAASSETAVFLR